MTTECIRPTSAAISDPLLTSDPHREYHIHAGKTEMADSLKKQFPGEEEAIDEFMRLMKVEGS